MGEIWRNYRGFLGSSLEFSSQHWGALGELGMCKDYSGMMLFGVCIHVIF